MKLQKRPSPHSPPVQDSSLLSDVSTNGLSIYTTALELCMIFFLSCSFSFPLGCHLYNEICGSPCVTMASSKSFLSRFQHFLNLLHRFLKLRFGVLRPPQDARQFLLTCKYDCLISFERCFCFLQCLTLERLGFSQRLT